MTIMAQDKKKPGRPAGKTTGSQLGITIDPEVRKATDAYIESYNAANIHRATLTSTVEAALKAFLKEQGFWPPKPTNGT